jgi:hypothetical protein
VCDRVCLRMWRIGVPLITEEIERFCHRFRYGFSADLVFRSRKCVLQFLLAGKQLVRVHDVAIWRGGLVVQTRALYNKCAPYTTEHTHTHTHTQASTDTSPRLHTARAPQPAHNNKGVSHVPMQGSHDGREAREGSSDRVQLYLQ